MTDIRYGRSIVWWRRDLRLADNRALYEAARSSQACCLAFVIDPRVLRDDPNGRALGAMPVWCPRGLGSVSIIPSRSSITALARDRALRAFSVLRA